MTLGTVRRSLAVVGVALVAGLLLAACGGSASNSGGGGGGNGGGGGQGTATSPPATSGSGGSASQYMTVDSANQKVTIDLNITGFNFDGFSNGQMTINVPQGWSVTMNCNNKSNIPHSCAIVQDATSTTPVFTGAETSDPISGLAPNTNASFTFTADTAGQYRVGCLVPGHMSAGMWDNFNVTSGGSPSISS